MKYQVVNHGARLEAVGSHSGYRIRMSTSAARDLDTWPVLVHVRGSESEDEVAVHVPKRSLRSPAEAFDFGYDCAVLYIDAEDRRIGA